MSADEIVKLLDELAAKLSDPAQHVYDIAVRQMIIEGIFQGILTVVFAVVVPLVLMRAVRKFNAFLEQDRKIESPSERWFSKNLEDYPVIETAASWIERGISFVSLLLGLTFFREALNYLLNPEWQVLLRLVKLVPGANL